MAKTFSITAEVLLSGPSNVSSFRNKLESQLSGIKVPITLTIPRGIESQISLLQKGLVGLNRELINITRNGKGAAGALSSLSSSVASFNSKSSASASHVANLNNNVAKTKTVVSGATSELAEFGRVTGLAIRRFAGFSVGATAIYGMVGAINNAVKESIEFERTMVKIQQLTGSTTKNTQNLAAEIGNLSTKWGVSSTELGKVAQTLTEAGLATKDTQTIMASLAKTMIAPSFGNITDTTDAVIASMAQFKLGAKDMEAALGSINAVSAQFAVESKDIVDAIKRTGGVFAMSSRGTVEPMKQLQQFIAVFTSIRATTRESAETIATGLRTIFVRIQRPETIAQLRNLGIELQDLQGRFVGPYEAANRLGTALSNMDPRSGQFAQIAEQLGGIRQISKVLPYITQAEVRMKAMAVAENGLNSVNEAAIIGQQALAVQLAKVHESFLALIRDISDSSSFKNFATIAMELAKGLISVGHALTPLLPMLGTLAAIKGFQWMTTAIPGIAAGLKGRASRMASGGIVPGEGMGDTVPAMLTPGEFVVKRTAAQAIGYGKLSLMNTRGYAAGGIVTSGRTHYGAVRGGGWDDDYRNVRSSKDMPNDNLILQEIAARKILIQTVNDDIINLERFGTTLNDWANKQAKSTGGSLYVAPTNAPIAGSLGSQVDEEQKRQRSLAARNLLIQREQINKQRASRQATDAAYNKQIYLPSELSGGSRGVVREPINLAKGAARVNMYSLKANQWTREQADKQAKEAFAASTNRLKEQEQRALSGTPMLPPSGRASYRQSDISGMGKRAAYGPTYWGARIVPEEAWSGANVQELPTQPIPFKQRLKQGYGSFKRGVAGGVKSLGTPTGLMGASMGMGMIAQGFGIEDSSVVQGAQAGLGTAGMLGMLGASGGVAGGAGIVAGVGIAIDSFIAGLKADKIAASAKVLENSLTSLSSSIDEAMKGGDIFRPNEAAGNVFAARELSRRNEAQSGGLYQSLSRATGPENADRVNYGEQLDKARNRTPGYMNFGGLKDKVSTWFSDSAINEQIKDIKISRKGQAVKDVEDMRPATDQNMKYLNSLMTRGNTLFQTDGAKNKFDVLKNTQLTEFGNKQKDLIRSVAYSGPNGTRNREYIQNIEQDTNKTDIQKAKEISAALLRMGMTVISTEQEIIDKQKLMTDALKKYGNSLDFLNEKFTMMSALSNRVGETFTAKNALDAQRGQANLEGRAFTAGNVDLNPFANMKAASNNEILSALKRISAGPELANTVMASKAFEGPEFLQALQKNADERVSGQNINDIWQKTLADMGIQLPKTMADSMQTITNTLDSGAPGQLDQDFQTKMTKFTDEVKKLAPAFKSSEEAAKNMSENMIKAGQMALAATNQFYQNASQIQLEAAGFAGGMAGARNQVSGMSGRELSLAELNAPRTAEIQMYNRSVGNVNPLSAFSVGTKQTDLLNQRSALEQKLRSEGNIDIAKNPELMALNLAIGANTDIQKRLADVNSALSTIMQKHSEILNKQNSVKSTLGGLAGMRGVELMKTMQQGGAFIGAATGDQIADRDQAGVLSGGGAIGSILSTLDPSIMSRVNQNPNLLGAGIIGGMERQKQELQLQASGAITNAQTAQEDILKQRATGAWSALQGGLGNAANMENGTREVGGVNLDTLLKSMDSLGPNIDKLANVVAAFKVPEKIMFEGRHDVNVNINGAEVFASLEPKIKAMIEDQMNFQFTPEGQRRA